MANQVETYTPKSITGVEERGEAQQIREFDAQQFLSFSLSDETMGLDIHYIKEIIEYTSITRVPMCPKYLRGVFNLRGQVLPVVDISAFFNVGEAEETSYSCIIVVEVKHENETVDLGILVDAVEAVLSFLPNEIEAPPNFGARIPTDYVWGLGRREKGFITLLNAELALDISQLSNFTQSDYVKKGSIPNRQSHKPSSDNRKTENQQKNEAGAKENQNAARQSAMRDEADADSPSETNRKKSSASRENDAENHTTDDSNKES